MNKVQSYVFSWDQVEQATFLNICPVYTFFIKKWSKIFIKVYQNKTVWSPIFGVTQKKEQHNRE